MAMSTMKDEERLDLLKEIGGSKVYEDRRKESLRILAETKGRKRQISELVADMEGKLQQLDQEKEELANFQRIDKERRSLEYAIYDKEVSDAGTKLEQVRTAAAMAGIAKTGYHVTLFTAPTENRTQNLSITSAAP